MNKNVSAQRNSSILHAFVARLSETRQDVWKCSTNRIDYAWATRNYNTVLFVFIDYWKNHKNYRIFLSLIFICTQMICQ